MPYTDIKIILNYVEANILINNLHHHNIDCFLADEYSSTTSFAPTVITARIMVNQKDLARAKHIIERFLKHPPKKLSKKEIL